MEKEEGFENKISALIFYRICQKIFKEKRITGEIFVSKNLGLGLGPNLRVR